MYADLKFNNTDSYYWQFQKSIISSNLRVPIILSKQNAGFFILEDGSPSPDVNKLAKYLNFFGLFPYVVQLSLLCQLIANKLQSHNFCCKVDKIILIGDGGLLTWKALQSYTLPNYLLSADVVHLKWSRKWENSKPQGFMHNLQNFDLKGSRILLVEDVIGSGETLRALLYLLHTKGATVNGLLVAAILGYSPIIENCYIPAIIAMKADDRINKKKIPQGFQNHWYPPFYSSRHIFFGDNEDDDFYEVLTNRYFCGDKTFISLIKQCLHNWS